MLEGAGDSDDAAEAYSRHFVDNARHGVGLIIQGSSCIWPEGRTSPGMTCVDTREKVMRLVDELGFDPVDAGRLEDSWRQQPGTPCYVADLDAPRLKAALAAADQYRVPEYRSKADEAARAFFASRLQPQ